MSLISAVHGIFGKNIFEHPIFYNNDVSLRFELENPEQSYSESVTQSIQRAGDLFDHLFAESESVVIVFQRFTRTRREKLRVPKKYLGEPIIDHEDLAIREIGRFEKRRYCSYKALDLRHQLIFDDVSNYRGHLAFYFFDLSREIMMHMYDDRGCDIVSTNVDYLAPLYIGFNEWLLDHDRDRMNRIFLRE